MITSGCKNSQSEEWWLWKKAFVTLKTRIWILALPITSSKTFHFYLQKTVQSHRATICQKVSLCFFAVSPSSSLVSSNLFFFQFLFIFFCLVLPLIKFHILGSTHSCIWLLLLSLLYSSSPSVACIILFLFTAEWCFSELINTF